MKTDIFTTLVEAQNYINENKYNGLICPCCGQNYKVWRKKPISTAVASLCKLVNLQNKNDDFYHLDEFNIIQKDRNFSQLVNWDLMKPKPNSDYNKRASGYWKPTEKGIQFVSDKLTIPKYVFTLNNKVIGYSEAHVNVHDALSGKFKYSELFE